MKIGFPQILLNLILTLFLVLTSQAITFNSPRQISLPTRQTAIASADLNEDGIPDLIIGGVPVGDEQGKIRVLLGNGNGTFKAPMAYQVGYIPGEFYNAPYVAAIKVADLNADGNLDVVVAHNGERSIANRSGVFATVLFGEGNGNLKPDNSYRFVVDRTGIVVNSIEFADFNKDGKTDVVLGCSVGSSMGSIYFLENLGGNKFNATGPKTIDANIYEIAAADVNNDSFSDLIMTAYEGVIILYGNGDFFSANIIAEQRDNDIFVSGLVVKDFNKDGRVDFAVARDRNSEIHIFLNSPEGFSLNPIIYQSDLSCSLLKNADIDNDGKQDLITSDDYNGNFQVFYGIGDGTFRKSSVIEVNLPVSDFTFADFDSNGKTDIAASLLQDSPKKQAAVFLNAPNPHRYFSDFDGDGKADIAVYRPSNAVWYILNSQNGFSAVQFGLSTDKIVPADYDGDGKTDIAVWRENLSNPDRANFYILNSGDGAVRTEQFGRTGDSPIAIADWDGDGRADPAVYRNGTGGGQSFFFYKPSRQPTVDFVSAAWGVEGDKPIVADYDGDGKADVAVYRPSNGVWYIAKSGGGFSFVQFGAAADKPVVGDYDGDGKSDQAVYRPDNGTWYINQSSKGFTAAQFGIATDLPVAADYDGDGKTDIAVYRPAGGNWYISRSTLGFSSVQFGASNDKPTPNAFVP